MSDEEARSMTPEELARAQRAEAGLCVRWGCGPDACVLPYDHRGPDQDAHGNSTLTLRNALLSRA